MFNLYFNNISNKVLYIKYVYLYMYNICIYIYIYMKYLYNISKNEY